MPEFTIAEAEEQAVKAGVYFGEVLERHGEGFIAVRVGDATIVVAVGLHARRLERALTKKQALGKGVAVTIPRVPLPKPAPAALDVRLVPMYHAPSDEYPNSRGSVHLHVGADVTVGRRVRKAGECLCTKKRGSRQRLPQGETNMCGECVKVAAEHGILWTL